ncbi:uncharacterized protein TM35_000084230 [Trypanosoma theileri]|uniref:Uncharacterized protein n=1 Tax=Trypanosoma theileri TaxID=67003 RepID=A0A1X0P148_9TRYP|nr:uncharacterized protein TM35_000084230 [Trypanosoma theileri]ORC90625.1 hypothetical protein TM35_000084230 [Trypanosoma theileri]
MDIFLNIYLPPLYSCLSPYVCVWSNSGVLVLLFFLFLLLFPLFHTPSNRPVDSSDENNNKKKSDTDRYYDDDASCNVCLLAVVLLSLCCTCGLVLANDPAVILAPEGGVHPSGSGELQETEEAAH